MQSLNFIAPIVGQLFRQSSSAPRSCPVATMSQPIPPSKSITPPPVKLRAVLYDLDGTCVNSDDIHYEAFQDAILRLEPSFNEGKPISREFYDENMSGRLNPVIVATLFPHLSQDEQTSLWQAKEAQYEDKIRLGVPPIDGLVDLIKRCQRHDIIQYIVTNAPKGSARTTLTSIKLAPFFGGNVVFGEECEHPKPHPEPYLHTLKLAGVEADSAIAFEDSVSGTTSATRAGIYTIGLRSTQPDTVLRAAGAAFTIADYTDPALQEFLAPNLGK